MTQKQAVNQLQLELTINQAIDDRLNHILPQMKEMLDGTQIWDSKMELHQLQNLLATAQDTGSVEVVKNFIRYQMGRDSQGNSWRKNQFGDLVINALDDLKNKAEIIVADCKGSESDIDWTWMALTRLYLGNLRRYFYYKKRSKGG
jgi:hypothetical protein